MSGLAFKKMHGLGNDFVVIDARGAPLDLNPDQVRAIADRRTGVGCDQLIVIEAPHDGGDAYMRIHNSDGAEVDACGNGSRCIGALLMGETGKGRTRIETGAGVIVAEIAQNGEISVDMGEARLDWRDIPLAREMDTLEIDFAVGPLSKPTAVGMGNPHAVFFVPDIAAVDLAVHGPRIERDPLFPARTNVEIVQVTAPERLRVRVWERGAGITRACGTGACASLVAAARRGLCGRSAEVELDGGMLRISWLDNNHVLMTGPVAHSFDGILGPALLS
jgi:diaminopimelate epimerase